MNKGYAFGFLLVLLVLVLGFYVALTSFRASREALLAEPASTPKAQISKATLQPATVGATAPAGLAVLATPIAGITATLTAVAQPRTTATPAGTPPKPGKTPAAKKGKGTATPTPVPASPTPIPIASYEFRLASPPGGDPNWPGCCYLIGTVRDAAGNSLEGVRVQVYNQWNPPVVAVTKGGNDLGKYDIPIGPDRVTWSMVLVNEAGDPISTRTDFLFDPAVANAFRVDWRRTH